MINTVNLSKSYYTGKTETKALKNINLTIKAGKIYTILGPSGSGKSTLLNCLSGIDKPTSGEILINDENITKLGDNKLTDYRAKNMGFIFQSFNLIPVLTAIENVQMPLLINGYSEKEAYKKSYKLLKKIGLKEKIESYPVNLSGGEAQRVAVARALINEPSIVWADEPTGSLDTKNSLDIMNLILELNKTNNQTFVVVTHDERLVEFSNYVFYMDSGEIVDFVKKRDD